MNEEGFISQLHVQIQQPGTSVQQPILGGKRIRTLKTCRISWSDVMEKRIFDYITETSTQGMGFEKPTAPEFYRRFMTNAVGFENVTVEKLIQHMRNMKASYSKALQWRQQTGQGILDETPTAQDTIKAEILKRCKYFYELDEILGEKPQFNPPYVHHTSVSENDSEDELEVNVSNVDVPNSEISTTVEFAATETPVVYKTSERKSKDIVPKEKFRKSPIKTASAALESAIKERATAENKRLTWEVQCRSEELEEKKRLAEIDFTSKKEHLEFERQKWKEEMDQRKISEDRKYELEKLKLLNDAELGKVKLAQEFELEKLRLQMKMD